MSQVRKLRRKYSSLSPIVIPSKPATSLLLHCKLALHCWFVAASLLLLAYQALFISITRNLNSIGQVQLLKDVLQVIFHRML